MATIQSLSIPTHQLTSSPSPAHITYTIRISTPASTYSLSHRYSSFLALHNQLLAISPQPAAVSPFPAKNSNAWFSLRRTLDEEQLRERRTALEKYLRTILSNKETSWRESKPFKEFLAPPPTTPSQSQSKAGEYTSSSWLTSHTSLQTSSKSLRSLISKRDSQILAKSAASHSTNAECRKALVEFVKDLELLKKGLEGLATRGEIVQGELERRRDLVGALEDDALALGKEVANPPKASLPSSSSREPPPSASRDALLPSSSTAKPSVRAFGAAAVESSETRPLDNLSLMALQDNYVDEQDQKLEELTRLLKRQGELGNMIGKELKEQEEVMDGLERQTDKVTLGMKKAEGKMKRLG